MRNRKGFTLVEILISVIILGLVMASVLSLFFSVFKSYEFHQDIMEAKQRGQIAVAAIQPVILNAGLGLPKGNTFFDIYKNRSNLIIKNPAEKNDTGNFRSSVQIADTRTASSLEKEGEALWVLYSVPSGAGVNYEYKFLKDDLGRFTEADGEIENLDKLDLVENAPANAPNLKGWVSFPGSKSAFFVTDIDKANGVLEIQSYLLQTIRAYDEIHYVRAAKIYTKIQNGVSSLFIDRIDGSGEHDAVEGIEALWFTYDEDGDGVLTVYVLSKADTLHSEQYQTSVEGWPASAPAPTDLRYRYTVVSKSWRIRN